jgi:ankyrin repeat protein
MADQTPQSGSSPRSLPDAANLEWLRKEAKRRLDELRRELPDARLADAQFSLAREYGFSSWRALKSHIDARTIDGQLFDAVRQGDAASLERLLDAHPDRLHARLAPYEWSLLHVAAEQGHLDLVNILLAGGLDPNTRERGDNTYAMHWAAAAGHIEIVRRLADAGGDVIGTGDDHAFEVIGWATCWDGGDDAAHRAIADFLVSRGARHHIFSAIALDLEDEVRRIVAADPSVVSRRLTRNEDHRTPLHFAVQKRRARMIAVLLELGADPLATDGSGESVVTYATTPDTDLEIMRRIRAFTLDEIDSAERGHRSPRAGLIDLVAALALGDEATAERLLAAHSTLLDAGPLHVMAKRGDGRAVRWLLGRGATPDGRWSHWDAVLTPLHLAAAHGHAPVVRALLAAGADPAIHDSKHDGDVRDWAQHFGQPEIVRILDASAGA